MTRLTQNIRERICRRAITAAFKDREAALKEQEHTLGMECYQAVIPESERKAAAAMPEGWLQMDACLRFNANGWDARLCVTSPVPVPNNKGYCRSLGSLTGDLAERVQAHLQEEKGLKEARIKAEMELSGFLEQFKTYKQLREAWPEGEPFYAEFDVEPKAGGVPAVRVAEINKLLNLSEVA